LVRQEGDINAQEWNEIIQKLPGAHVLQIWEWGEIKAAVGWKAIPRLWKNDHDDVIAAALVLQRELKIGPLKTGLKVQYIPRGPLMDWADDALRIRVLDDLQSLARTNKAIMIKMDPEVLLGTGIPGADDAVDGPTGKRLLQI
jgi:peptidoglycan pentaglycine glycine transferase (the first glycine)